MNIHETWNIWRLSFYYTGLLYSSVAIAQGFLELRSAWSCVNLGIQELVAMWSTSQQVITGNDLQSPFWIDLMLEGASTSYGQTCDGARLLTWGNGLLSDNAIWCNLMQVFGLVLKQSEKLFIVSFSKIFSWVGHAQNGSNLRFLPTLRSVAHHELHAQGTKHFGLWYDVSTFTFLHSGSGKYFGKRNIAAKITDAKQHAGSIRYCWTGARRYHIMIHIVSSDSHFKMHFPTENQ